MKLETKYRFYINVTVLLIIDFRFRDGLAIYYNNCFKFNIYIYIYIYIYTDDIDVDVDVNNIFCEFFRSTATSWFKDFSGVNAH